MSGKALTVGLFIFGLLLASLIFRSGDLAWMALPFLAYLAVGILQAPSLERVSLSASRTVESTGPEDAPAVHVQLSVSCQGRAIGQLLLYDRLQPGMEVVDGSPYQRVALGSGGDTWLQYTFRAGRGVFRWGAVQAVLSDPFDLVKTPLAVPASAELQVLPAVAKFRPLPLRTRRTLPAPGPVPAGRGGSGTDFWGVRPYQPGDSLRWLDWRLTARYPHKFFTKEFEQEETAEIGIILDGRQKMELALGNSCLFECSLGAAASLAEMFLHQGHRVSMLVLGEKLERVFPGYGKQQLHRILRLLAQAQPGTHDSYDSLHYLPLRHFPGRSLIVVLSPLTPADWPLFPTLRAYGHQALLISPDPLDFARPLIPDDEAGRLALRAARLERLMQLSKIVQLQIPVIDWKVSQPLYPLVRSALRRTRALPDW